ncbi:uncharacterized protein PADG_01435 [Paracoccidioides brasiliensis Pb18]|uniref:Uncharacterized protein n=1 Tax=Paracoccidioides brasiliensis (strain Pb18) TaxID=502780 RepID=C1G3B9_PARBD|nr:uncharacterized protein PADG_01435 [Paracoccidioides brasiliensis Pb18]EEH45285.2 hypothetical protein PADG_01435 [Paracoccidioides brasiliensis Pb18]
MFSPNSSSACSNPTSRSRAHASNFTLPLPAELALPTGECRSILLHPSVPDQRCSCQGFRRNMSSLGSTCECGHQACYHAPGNRVSSFLVQQPVSPPVLPTKMALLERICRLEEQHRHDRRLWEEELKEERRARREDTRVLREAMHSFYKFMEGEVPRKFAAVDDKTDSLLDHVSRLEERITIVDDSTMALENRVSDLEIDEDEDGDNSCSDESHSGEMETEESNEHGQRGDENPNPVRAMRKSSERDPVPIKKGTTCPKLNSTSQFENGCPYRTSMAPPAGVEFHPASLSIPTSSKSPRKADIRPSSPTAISTSPLDLVETYSAATGAHTYVHKLTSSPPRDFVSPLPPKPETPTCKPMFHGTVHSEMVPLVKSPISQSSSAKHNEDFSASESQQQCCVVYPEDTNQFSGPYCELPNSVLMKRKFEAGGRQQTEMERGLERRDRPKFIPIPPPLSL